MNTVTIALGLIAWTTWLFLSAVDRVFAMTGGAL